MATRRDFVRSAVAASLGAGAAPLTLSAEPGVRGRRTGTGLVFDAHLMDHVNPPQGSGGTPHPERPERLIRIREALMAEGLWSEMQRLNADAVDPRPFIETHHEPQHVEAIRRLGVTASAAQLAVAGALSAVQAVAHGRVRNAFCAIRPPGHHANNTGREEGFCFYSNAAIAARYAQQVFGYEKILIVDWDYHHGNATQNAFYDDPSVLFFSTHDFPAYPGTGDPALRGEGEGTGLNINVHLDCGARDQDMLNAWDRQLLPAVESFRPDLVIVSAGFDSRRDDLLGCFDVSDDAFVRMTRTAMELADHYCDGRLVSLLEGGYNIDGTARAAAAHVGALMDGS